MEGYPRNPEEFSDGRRKLVIADVGHDLEAKAADIALDKSTESTEKPRGIWNRIKSFGTNIWKRSEIFQTRERHKARTEIKRTGRLYGETEAANQAEIDAITRRFTVRPEFEDEFIHKAAGESREQLGNSEAEVRLKSQIQDLIRSYARGDVNDEGFATAKEQIFAGIKGLKPQAVDKGKMYVDNILQIAREAKEEVRRQVEQRVDHEAAIQGLDLDFDVVIGKARAGVRTEAQFNAVDRIVDKIQRGTGGMLNEYAVASAVAIANTLFKTVVQGSVRRAASAFGLGMAATGAAAGLKESRKIEVERSQHAREMAQGKRVKDPANAERRRELEESRIQTKTVRELETNLNAGLFERLATKEAKDLTAAEYQEALKALADIDSRIQISDQGIVKDPKTSRWQFWKSEKLQRIDLIGYSDMEKVSQERDRLDVLRARAKVELRKYAAANGRDLRADLNAGMNTVRQEVFAGDQGIERQNEIFNKLKQKRVWSAIKRGALVGGAIGLATQEIMAFFQDGKEGALEHGWHALRNQTHPRIADEHVTLAEGVRRRITDYFEGSAGAGPDFSNLHNEVINGHNFKLAGGLNLQPDGAGGYRIFENGQAITDPFRLNPDGSLTPDARKYLLDHGFGPYDETTQLPGGATHPLTLDETKAKFTDLDRHARSDWHDRPGKWYSNDHKAFIEFEGKQQNVYLEQAKDGTVLVNAKRIMANLEENLRNRLNDSSFGQNPDGSFDQKLIHLRDQMLGWMNNGTLQEHMQVAVIPTEAANDAGLSTLIEGAQNGKIALPKEYSDLFTNSSMLRDGKLPIRFLELRIDGHVLATAQGGEIEVPNTVVHTLIGNPHPPDFITTPPLIIPPGNRKGLEETEKTPVDAPPVPIYGYGYGYATQEQRRAAEAFYRSRLSPTLRSNPEAVLNFATESEWYFQQQLQNPEYGAVVNEMLSQPGMREPMDKDCRAAVCIPVYTLGEGKIIVRTLDLYRKQVENGSVKAEEFELILFLNHPKEKREALNMLPGAEDRVRQGNPEAYDTEEVIRQYSLRHPEMKIRVMKKEFDQRPQWGQIIKYTYDIGCIRAKNRTGANSEDIILLTNDADSRDMSDKYLRLTIDSFKKGIDGAATRMDYDPEIYKKWPTVFMALRFMQFLEAQTRNPGIMTESGDSEYVSEDGYIFRSKRKGKEKYINTWGASSAIRGSIYCATGGANKNTDAGADTELGLMIVSARRGNKTDIDPEKFPMKFVNAAWLETDPRRQLDTYKKGKPLIATWSEWADMNVYGQTQADQTSGDSEDLNLDRLSNEMNLIASKWWSTSMDSPIAKRALNWMGLRDSDYVIKDGRIRITNSDNLRANLDKWKPKRERLEDAKSNKITTKLESDFRSAPMRFVYGGDLSRVKQPGVGLGKFIKSVREKFGINDAEYASIQTQAAKMPNRNGFSGAQKELALIMREAAKSDPSVMESLRASSSPAEYQRWARDIITLEAKGSLDSRQLTPSRINSMATEFGVTPDLVINAAISGRKELRTEARRRFGAVTSRRTNPLPRNDQTRALIDRQLLQEYQAGSIR